MKTSTYTNNGKIKLYENPIKKFSDIYKIDKKINNLKKNDYWYQKKFINDLQNFPFFFSIFKNFPRNLSILFYLSLYKIFSSNKFYNSAWKVALANNFNYVIKSYQNREMTNLLVEEVKLFKKFAKKNNCEPVVIIFPYLDDLNYISKKKIFFYKKIVKKISLFSEVIDLSSEFIKKKNKNKYYVSKFYGSHLSKYGNKMVAKSIFIFLRKKFNNV